MLACTFVHAKFNHRAPEGKAMLRCFLGGRENPEVLGLHDDEVVAVVRRELREIMSFTAEPLFSRVQPLACFHGAISRGPQGTGECYRRAAPGPARIVPCRECLLGNRHFGLHPDREERCGKGPGVCGTGVAEGIRQ